MKLFRLNIGLEVTECHANLKVSQKSKSCNYPYLDIYKRIGR